MNRFEESLLSELKAVSSELHLLHSAITTSAAQFKSCSCHLATKADLDKVERNIMASLNEYLKNQKQWNESHGAAINEVAESVTDLTGDVKTLNDKITELQNSQGGVTPEDQGLIDELQGQGQALTEKLQAASAALKALAAQTPPVTPPTPA